MNVLGIIPARYDSSRFPGKPLILLNGKTMIQRVYEGASRSKKLSRLIVATDDHRIIEEVIRFGGEAVMTDKHLPSGTDRCAAVARQVSQHDVVVNIQGDEPLVDYRQLDQLIGAFSSREVSIASLGICSVSQEDRLNPNRIKVVVDKNNQALYFSRSPIPNTDYAQSSSASDYPFMRHIGLYAYRSEVLQQLTNLKPTILEQTESLEQLRWLYHGFSIHIVQTTIETPNIDVPEDVKKVLEILNQ